MPRYVRLNPETVSIIEAVLAEFIARDQFWRESLKHPKHSDILLPLRKRLERILIRRWNKQQKAFLAEARHWLGKFAAGHFTEADADLKARLQRSVTAKINAGTALSQPPSRSDTDAYNALVEAASEGAVENLSIDLNIEAAADLGKRFAQAYLKDQGFHQLAADIDSTTRDRMASAVSESFASGGTMDDAVSAIKGVYADMKDSRAETIAQTEMSDAYNQALLSSAKETEGELLKTWELDGEGCEEICQPNADDGAIELDEDFSSGDDAPPAHPNCDCSIGFVRADEA